jgi:hypothetical protein
MGDIPLFLTKVQRGSLLFFLKAPRITAFGEKEKGPPLYFCKKKGSVPYPAGR